MLYFLAFDGDGCDFPCKKPCFLGGSPTSLRSARFS